MSKNSPKDVSEISAKIVQRREALKGLGALATSSALAIACGASENGAGGGGATSSGNGGAGNGGAGNGGAPGQGGAPGSGGAGNAGANANGGSGTGGAANGGASAGGAQNGGASAGGSANGGSGVSGGTANGGSANGGKSSGGSTGTGGAGNSEPLSVPKFDDVPTCTASKTDIAGQGPFFIHEGEKNDDISLIRQDIRGRYNQSAADGVEMQLHLRILDSTSTSCNGSPVADADIYIWHTDAQGFYSGFGKRGTNTEQKPDTRYSGVPSSMNLENTDRFCRGIQSSNAQGVVSFRSIFPGWYNGRDVHIHFVAFKKGSMSAGRVDYSKQNSGGLWLFTTQFYFDPAFTDMVHTKYDPYKARTTGSLANTYKEAIKADEPNNSGLRAKALLNGDIVVAQMQILLVP